MNWATTIGAVLVVSVGVCAHGQTITTGSLVGEMIDMPVLARFPNPAYRTVQYSSYDHRSVLPGGPEWFANSDGFGSEPVPNFEAVLREPDAEGIGEYLICDVNGPGTIVRTWTAAINGEVRMYLDGADTPVFDAPADDFFRRPFNVFARALDLDEGLFDGTFNQQNASYCPIPFAERCRIVWTGRLKELHFYEVQMRLYEASADVETFRPEDLRTHMREIRRVAQVLGAPSEHWEYSGGEPVPIIATVPPGEARDILVLEDGPRALERLTLRVHAVGLDRALRQTVMQIRCDGWPWGQVQSPIGDFFGAGPGVNPYDSVPFTVEAEGTMTCRFVMPYKESVRITLENRGVEEVTVTGSALPIAWDWGESSLHFRARWRVDHDLIGDRDAVQDLPFVIAHGRGRYVGTASILLNPADVPTPAGSWWGEGDEKIFVDDDVRPSTFGTGSEDYFNYAWSIPDLFAWAYCGQVRNDGPGNRGFVTNNRWHVLDNLPFERFLAFYMELFMHRRTEGFSYARIGYYYAARGTVDDHVGITGEDIRMLDLPPDWRPVAWWGAADSVFHEPETLLVTQGAALMYEEDNLYSGGRVMVWRPARTGETLVFGVPVAEVARHNIDLCVAKGPEGGSFWAGLGQPPSSYGRGSPEEPYDTRAAGPSHLRRVGGEPVELAAGEHTLTLTFTGEPGQTVAIDFIWVQKR